ncbi:hypothetical protein Baya_1533 [Bagarius yarrelli]|uniref:Uncharacterized protein n=1 Tax=Bagarius yarrelli TaxID=175774 RepID=A0A556TLD1_BAGYA|nr:hypothetical protein Baya_1533 [Bagarius yarrelli]
MPAAQRLDSLAARMPERLIHSYDTLPICPCPTLTRPIRPSKIARQSSLIQRWVVLTYWLMSDLEHGQELVKPCTRSSQTLPVDGGAEAQADGQIDGLADEFLAGALSEEKQFKTLGGRGAIWSSHQRFNVENSQISALPLIIKPATAAELNEGWNGNMCQPLRVLLPIATHQPGSDIEKCPPGARCWESLARRPCRPVPLPSWHPLALINGFQHNGEADHTPLRLKELEDIAFSPFTLRERENFIKLGLMGRMGFGVGVTDDRDGWPRTKHVLTTSEYGATLQKGQHQGEREKGEKSEPRMTFKVSPMVLVCEGVASGPKQPKQEASQRIKFGTLTYSKEVAVRIDLGSVSLLPLSYGNDMQEADMEDGAVRIFYNSTGPFIERVRVGTCRRSLQVYTDPKRCHMLRRMYGNNPWETFLSFME